MKFSKHEEMSLALLRHALNGIQLPEQLFTSCREEDWRKCYVLLIEQGVMAIAWEAVISLPPGLQPSKQLRIKWALSVENYSDIYMRHCAVADEISRFYAAHGISTLLLKGIGLSTYYPMPQRRQSGDIDIYTFSSDKSKMSDSEASELADRLMRDKGIDIEMHSCKHSSFTYKGVSIENHKFFTNVDDSAGSAEIEALLHKKLKPQTVEINGGGRILVPSPEFNCLFVSVHALQHFNSGLRLIHLCDWACVLKKIGNQLPELKDRRQTAAIHALTTICRDYLGSDYEGSEESNELSELILREIIRPTFRTGKIPHNWSIRTIWYKIRRFVYFAWLKSKICDISPAGALWGFMVSQKRRTL